MVFPLQPMFPPMGKDYPSWMYRKFQNFQFCSSLASIIRIFLLFSLIYTQAAGLIFLRSRFYPLLLGKCGRNVFFGSDITLRHPHKIKIGDDVVIDDGCVLDAKGLSNHGITIGNGVFIGRQTSLNTKDGNIELEDGVNIGAFCTVFSASQVRCGKNTLIAAYSYLVGGGHDMTDTETAVIDQGRPSLPPRARDT